MRVYEVLGTPSTSRRSSVSAATTTTNTARVSSAVGRRSKKRKKVSWVYNHFALDEASNRISCLVSRCKTHYSSGTSTATLALHLTKIHKLNKEGTGAVNQDPDQATFSKDGARLVVGYYLLE